MVSKPPFLFIYRRAARSACQTLLSRRCRCFDREGSNLTVPTYLTYSVLSINKLHVVLLGTQPYAFFEQRRYALHLGYCNTNIAHITPHHIRSLAAHLVLSINPTPSQYRTSFIFPPCTSKFFHFLGSGSNQED